MPRRFGLLDDPVGHGDGFDGVHRSIRHLPACAFSASP